MKFGVLVFPGSNCDHDTHHVLGGVLGQPVTYLWHESHDLENCDAIIVPGGFAFGDYLRTGAIAKFWSSGTGGGMKSLKSNFSPLASHSFLNWFHACQPRQSSSA